MLAEILRLVLLGLFAVQAVFAGGNCARNTNIGGTKKKQFTSGAYHSLPIDTTLLGVRVQIAKPTYEHIVEFNWKLTSQTRGPCWAQILLASTGSVLTDPVRVDTRQTCGAYDGPYDEVTLGIGLQVHVVCNVSAE